MTLSYFSFFLHLICLKDAASSVSLFFTFFRFGADPRACRGKREIHSSRTAPNCHKAHCPRISAPRAQLCPAITNKASSPALWVSGCNSQLCAAKSRWQPWHEQRQYPPRKSQPPASLQSRNSSSKKQLLPPLPGQGSSLLTWSWACSQHTQSTQGLPADPLQHQVSHCRPFAIR